MINFPCNPSRHGLPCATAVRFSRWGLRADGRGQGRAVAASSGTPLFVAMPGLVPLLAGSGSGAGSTPMSETVAAPRCHPGLVPGSREAGRERCRCPGPRHKAGVTAGGNDGRCRRAQIRVSRRAILWNPARTQAIHPARKIQTGQQWNKASHDETGSPPDAAIRRPGGRGRAFPTSGPAARARGRPRAGG